MQKPSVPANIQTPMTLLLCILWQTRITLHLLLDSAQRYQCINSTLQYRFCLHGKKVMTIFASSKSHGYGKMPEWSIGAVSKTVVLTGTQGSNPCLSAKKAASQRLVAFLIATGDNPRVR